MILILLSRSKARNLVEKGTSSEFPPNFEVVTVEYFSPRMENYKQVIESIQ